jgi:hypothetical protein
MSDTGDDRLGKESLVGRTTYARAQAGYDVAFKDTLTEAIFRAITDVSFASDLNCIAIRTGETSHALADTLALFLALSPAATRSPKAIREMTDDLRKRLIKNVAAARANPATQDFLARVFRGDDDERGGHG